MHLLTNKVQRIFLTERAVFHPKHCAAVSYARLFAISRIFA